MRIFKKKTHNEGANDNKGRLVGYFKRGADTVYRTFKRFPVTILLCAALAGILIYRVETPYEKLANINTMLDRLMAVLIMGIPLSLSVSLFIEKTGKDRYPIYKLVLYAVEIGALVLYYLFLMPDTQLVSMVRLLLVTGALSLGFLFIPFLPNKENFEVYVTRIMSRAVVTSFFAVVLGLGLMAIIFAVKSLLFTDLSENYYAYVWILVLTLFASFHFLSDIPQVDETIGEDQFNKVLKVLLLYIVLPVISIYTVVLYIYFAKIIITQVWPEGIVSYLVVSYTAIGIATIFLVSPFRSQSRWVGIFVSAFTKLIFPLLVMMFISIGIRIGDFGFTENRYFIVIIGIWSSGILIFLNLTRCRRNIVLPVSLAIVALLSVFGPWSAFSVSKASQNQRFYNIAVKYDMIQNGKVTKVTDIDRVDKKEISGILTYFDRTHQLEDLKYLPSGFTMMDMQDVFGFSEFEYVQKDIFFNYRRYPYEPMPITGYDFLFKVQAYKYQYDTDYYSNELLADKGKIKVVIDKDLFIYVYDNDTEVYKSDLKGYIYSIYEKYGTTSNNGNKEDMIYIDDNEKIGVMVSFNNIDGTVGEGEKNLVVSGIEADILIRR